MALKAEPFERQQFGTDGVEGVKCVNRRWVRNVLRHQFQCYLGGYRGATLQTRWPKVVAESNVKSPRIAKRSLYMYIWCPSLKRRAAGTSKVSWCRCVIRHIVLIESIEEMEANERWPRIFYLFIYATHSKYNDKKES